MPVPDALQQTIEIAAGGRRSAPITLGAAGPDGLVAWIESPHDIATLFVAAQGRILLERSLARSDTADFGYEGCSARHLSWYGTRVVVVTSERYYFVLLSVEPSSGDEESLPLSGSWQIDRDLLLFVDDHPGLVSMVALPSLEARPPLPIRGVPARGEVQLQLAPNGRLQVASPRHSDAGTVELLALPTDRQRADYQPVDDLLDAVERRLFPSVAAPMGARFVIQAVAHAFVPPPPPRNRPSVWRPSPVWMPVYWHRHLVSTGRKQEAGQLLRLLDEIAGPLPETQPESGWDPGWSTRDAQFDLAARYVPSPLPGTSPPHVAKARCPQGWHCLLFDPAPQSKVFGSRVDPLRLSARPPGNIRAPLAQTPPRTASNT